MSASFLRLCVNIVRDIVVIGHSVVLVANAVAFVPDHPA
jgi:hypothetical protein